MYIQNWRMSYGGYTSLAANTPCTMYSVLLDHGIIEDPYYGLNEQLCTCLSDHDCTFISELWVDNEILDKDHAELTFYGLDTICRIYLNDTFLDSVNNMHCAYTYDVKRLLMIGMNRIRLEFASPTRYFREHNARHYVWSGNDCLPGAAHLRKALYMSGWDWGPKLPDMGIFRPVELNAYDVDRIEDVFVKQNHHDGVVDLEITVSTKHQTDAAIHVEMDGQRLRLKNGKGTLRIDHPKLWWVRGYGEPHLYDLRV